MALYIIGYTLGRGWIENLRVDSVQMNDVFGLRLNVWTSIVLFVVGAAWFWWSARRHPGREETVYVERGGPGTQTAEATGEGDSSDEPESPDASGPASGASAEDQH